MRGYHFLDPGSGWGLVFALCTVVLICCFLADLVPLALLCLLNQSGYRWGLGVAAPQGKKQKEVKPTETSDMPTKGSLDLRTDFLQAFVRGLGFTGSGRLSGSSKQQNALRF